MRIWLLFLLPLLAAPASPQPRNAAARQETLILRGGPIYTLDPKQPWASALVIEDGRIAYVGNDAGARASAGKDTRAIDLAGRMVLPGFHDAHIHPMTGAMRLLRCRLNDFRTAREVYAAVRACAATEPKREWLVGNGWSPQAFGNGGPSREKLDELVPDRPAFLSTEDGYTVWVNSKALAAAGIPANRANGVIEDELASRVRRQLPQPSEAEYREALRRSTAIANSFGITSVFEASANAAVLEAYRAADRAGELTVRVVAAQRIDAARGAEQLEELIERRDRLRGSRFRADAAKIFLDGGDIGRHEGAMLAPFADMPGSSGKLFIAPDALNVIVRRLDAAGFLIHMHAMGDRAVRVGLDAIEHAVIANGAGDRRHQLTHLEVVDSADIPRFGKLAVAANFQPVWFRADDPATGSAETALGPERSRALYPIASIDAAGGKLIASSDWPGPSMNPLDAIEAAVTRAPLADQRVGLAAMLAAYTSNASWGAREDTINGSIEVGKAADLVVLDRNLFEIDAKALHEARVLLTLLDGEPVYGDPALLLQPLAEKLHD